MEEIFVSNKMEFFLVEVIGNILLKFGVVCDVVVVFIICCKWRVVVCYYFNMFCFNIVDWFVYWDFVIEDFEVFII